jgi:signal transduction histidine kinase
LVDISDFIQRNKKVRPQFEAKESLEPRLAQTLLADEDRIVQVLTNLTENALQHN